MLGMVSLLKLLGVAHRDFDVCVCATVESDPTFKGKQSEVTVMANQVSRWSDRLVRSTVLLRKLFTTTVISGL